MDLQIPHTISTYLDIEIGEVKRRIPSMSVSEMYRLVQAIREDDKEQAFKIYSGSAL